MILLFVTSPQPGRNSENIHLPIEICKPDTTYEYSIMVIKKHEKFSPVRYTLFGDEYIGYGHLLYDSDTVQYLTEKQADSISRLDFNKAVGWVNRHVDNIPINQKHVIAMLVFNIRHDKLHKSTLIKMIRQRESSDVIRQQYYKYTWAGKRYLPKMKMRRMDEFKIW